MKVLLPLPQEYLTCHHQTPNPACRSRQTSLSQVLVDQERHIPLQESFVTAGSQSTWQPQVRYPEGTMPQSSHRDLNACPSLSWTLRLEPIPICPSLCGWHRPRCGNGDTICLFSESFCTRLRTQRVSGSLRTEHTQASQHTGRSSAQSPSPRPGTRPAPCSVTSAGCRD